MGVSYIHALAVCVEHYMERGFNLEKALTICLREKEEVFRAYNIIEEEKRRGYYPHQVPFPYLTERSEQTDILEADR